jgi:replicative DNA helicase
VKPMFDREPPKDVAAEMALLGSFLTDPSVINDAQPIERGDFYAEKHGTLYAAIADVYDRTGELDLVLLQSELVARKVLDQIGGGEYLVELANGVPTAVNAPHYARIVREKATLRRIIDAASTTLYEAYNAADFGPSPVVEIIDRAESRMFVCHQHGKADTTCGEEDLASIMDREVARMERAEKPRAVATRYVDLDEKLGGGFHAGELIVIGARPSMGKTALMLNMATNIAQHGTPVGILSMEMSREALVLRAIASEARVDLAEIRGGVVLQDATLKAVYAACEVVKGYAIQIDDTPALTVATARTKARRMIQRHGVQVLFVDYLQLMTAPGSNENRQTEVSAISRGLKSLARETGVPVVALSQLNRSVEGRSDFRPRMSDLRESGSIEQDADVITLLHREEYYHPGDTAWAQANSHLIGIGELIVAKNRNGKVGTVGLSWNPERTRFESAAEWVDIPKPTAPPKKFGQEPKEPKTWVDREPPPVHAPTAEETQEQIPW